MAAKLHVDGLLPEKQSHAENPYYPAQKHGDFADDYDPEHSANPWDSLRNCAWCGRLHSCFDDACVSEVRHFDPYRRKYVYSTMCSPSCKQSFKDFIAAEVMSSNH